jgi:hypothetical protein
MVADVAVDSCDARVLAQEGLGLRREYCRGACPQWLGHV